MQKALTKIIQCFGLDKEICQEKRRGKKKATTIIAQKSQEEMRQQLRTITGWSPTICL
jgi:hypothetical protein